MVEKWKIALAVLGIGAAVVVGYAMLAKPSSLYREVKFAYTEIRGEEAMKLAKMKERYSRPSEVEVRYVDFQGMERVLNGEQ